MLFAHVRFRNTIVFPLSQMTRHYSSVNILVETFQLSWKKLIIPFFMLFVSCMLFAVFFHMAEKGHVCEVDGSGTACVSNDDEGKPARDLVSSIVGIDLADDAIASIGGESEAKHAVVQVMAESGSLTAIPSSFEGLWMALVTVTTVGYGRWGYPVTPVGKIIASFVMIFGSCYMSMPLFIVGGSFYQCYKNHVQRERARARELHFREEEARKKKEEEEKNKYKVKLSDEQGAVVTAYKELAVNFDKISRVQKENYLSMRAGNKIPLNDEKGFAATHLGGMDIRAVKEAHFRLAMPLRFIVEKMRDIHKPTEHKDFGEAAGPLFG
jgi:hypothetical protein